MSDGSAASGDWAPHRTRSILLVAALALALVAVAVFALGAVSSYGRLFAAFGRVSASWLPLCATAELAAYGGYIVAYREVARTDGGFTLGYWQVTRIVALGFGASVVGSSAGSLAVDYQALRGAGAAAHESARRVLALNTLDWAVLSLATVGAAGADLLGAAHDVPTAMPVAWLCAVALCVSLATWLSAPGHAPAVTPAAQLRRPRGRRLRAWLRWALGEGRRLLEDAIGGVVLTRHIIANPRMHWPALAGFSLFWLGDIGCAYAAVRAAGDHIEPAALVLAYASSYAVTILPLPAGGAGGIEASLALTLHLVGLPLASAIVAVVVYRGFTFWLPVVPAALTLPTLGSLRRELALTHRVHRPEPR